MILKRKDKKTLKERLADHMASKNMSVAQLEKKAGVKRNVARNILQGKSIRPLPRNLEAIARALDCAPQELMPDYQQNPASPRVSL
jgi:transcriptional regulator with XRE-family HTH domain